MADVIAPRGFSHLPSTRVKEEKGRLRLALGKARRSKNMGLQLRAPCRLVD